MGDFFLAQAQNKTTQAMSCNKVVSGSLMAAGDMMLGKAANDRHNELNRKLPFHQEVNEKLKEFAKGTQMRMMRDSMLKEIKENANKHSKSLMGFMTGFGLIAAGTTLALLNRNNKNKVQEETESSNVIFDKEHIKNSAIGAVEVGALGYALGFTLGVAGTGAFSLATGHNLDTTTISNAIKNGNMSGMGSAAMGIYIGSQKDCTKAVPLCMVTRK